MSEIILQNRRKWIKYEVNIPAEHKAVFENTMRSYGWKPQEKSEFMQKPIVINLDEEIKRNK